MISEQMVTTLMSDSETWSSCQNSEEDTVMLLEMLGLLTGLVEQVLEKLNTLGAKEG